MGRDGGKAAESATARDGGTNTAQTAGTSGGEGRGVASARGTDVAAAEAPSDVSADAAGEAESGAGAGVEADSATETAAGAVAAPEETSGESADGARAGGARRGTPRGGSRRFPRLTRDTARPEGGGRVFGAEHAAPYRQWPLLAVCAGVLLGLLVTIGEFRIGCLLIGLSLLGGAGLRWWLPSVGMLAVRSRFTDLVTYGVLGVVIVLLTTMAQPDPWITVPFLEDVVHFSIR